MRSKSPSDWSGSASRLGFGQRSRNPVEGAPQAVALIAERLLRGPLVFDEASGCRVERGVEPGEVLHARGRAGALGHEELAVEVGGLIGGQRAAGILGRIDRRLGEIDLVGGGGPGIGEALLLGLRAADVLAQLCRLGTLRGDLILDAGDGGVLRRHLVDDRRPALALLLEGGDVDLVPRQILDLLVGGAAGIERVEFGGGVVGGRLRGLQLGAGRPELRVELADAAVGREPQHVATAVTAVRAAGAVRRLPGEGQRHPVLRELGRRVDADVAEAAGRALPAASR